VTQVGDPMLLSHELAHTFGGSVGGQKLYLDGDERYRTFLYGAEHDKDVSTFTRFESTP
jgi:hypothetical protein